ncbi:hypothetical protein [Jeotgalibacillus haloalkalitolerans]|uniref:Lipoprotein n=1 Tax=Jeotgalibacillus haloalkalitolerans TaxID=3104292 RepID=A0ABU5KJM6_9BACL|nr:hypothetical protein [Jeotgalibacillus sp. HH7-29]MDZ5711344.1 hypothetical protein [Jeotgalibacillus sp. HH7-29]
MKKIILTVLIGTFKAGCSIEAWKADPDKEKVMFEFKKEDDAMSED